MEQKKQKLTPQVMEDRLIEFAARVIDVVEALPPTPVGKHIGGQMLRSGTSPALNYGEAQVAESRGDFIHKMKICLKELRETLVCLKIIVKRNWFQESKLDSLMIENNELVAIFIASTKTAVSKK